MKPAAQEPIASIDLPQTALSGATSAAPKDNRVPPTAVTATTAATSARNNQDSRPISQAISAGTTSANSSAVTGSLQRTITDARDKLVQAIEATLQAEISAAPAKAISSAESASAGNGNLGQQNSANLSPNSNAQDLLKQYADGAGVAASQSGNSGQLNEASANNSVGAAAKAVALAGPALEPAARVTADPAPQGVTIATAPANAQSGSTNSPSASTARPEPPPQPLPQSLPQSLSDVAKASELYQRVGGSEMHIAMETDLLGAVDLRATMHQSALTATIGVQRADVQALLSNELPALQHTLAEKNFHIEQISVLNNSVGDRAGSGGQQQAPAQNQNPSAPHGGYLPTAAGLGANKSEDMRVSAGASSMAQAWSGQIGRISVHV